MLVDNKEANVESLMKGEACGGLFKVGHGQRSWVSSELKRSWGLQRFEGRRL